MPKRTRVPGRKPASIWPIHRIADAAEERLMAAFRVAWLDMRTVLSLADLEDAYRRNSLEGLWQARSYHAARNLLLHRITDALEVELQRAGAAAVKGIPVRKLDADDPETMGLFRVLNQRAIDWAEREAAQLVRQVDEETKRAIRALVRRMQQGQLTPQQAARQLRQVVGLTRLQAIAVDNFRRNLEAKAGLIEDQQAAARALTDVQRQILGNRVASTEDRIDRLVARYEARLLRYRTETIARTESMTAAIRGQQEAWRAAIDEGLLDPDQIQVWLVTPDERLCEICAPMDHQTAPIGGVFTNPETFAQYSGPPIHPNCRCDVTLQLTVPELDAEGRDLASRMRVDLA